MNRLRFLKLFLLPAFCAGMLEQAAAETTAESPLGALKKGDFAAALKEFENQPRSAKEAYNLGYAAYQVEDFGRAHAFWHQALVLDPSFRKASKALEFGSKQGRFASAPRNWRYDWTFRLPSLLPTWMLNLLAAALLGIFIRKLFSYMAYRRRAYLSEVTPTWPRPTLYIYLALSLMLVTVALLTTWAKSTDWASITQTDLPLVAFPEESSFVVSEVRRPTVVEILRRQEDWVQVRLPNGSAGWLPTSHLLSHRH